MFRKKLVLVQFIINLCLCYGLRDRTLEDGSCDADVVDAVLKKIKDSAIFNDDDNGIMKRIAYVESRFGCNKNTSEENYNGGIWRISEKGAFTNITRNRENYKHLNDDIIPAIKSKFGVDFRELGYKKLLKPLYSGLAARMVLLIIGGQVPEHFEIEEQGNYWKNKYNNGNISAAKFVKDVNEMEKEFGTCRGRMDLAIVMDGSGSIGERNYEFAKSFVAQLIQTFSMDSVNVGFVVFSTSSQVIFPLDSNLTQTEMVDKVKNSFYPMGWTYTDLGINSAIKILGESKNREGIPKIMAIFTDGDPTCEEKVLDRSLKSARSKNVTIFAIGIGNDIKIQNLRKMSNSSSRVFSMSSFKSLSQSFTMINSETCKIPQKPVVGSNLTDVLAKFEKRYFHFKLPPIGITIKIEIKLGNTRGYYSYTLENPSSALNDGEFTGQVFIPSKHSNSGRFKRDVSENATVFVAVEGKEHTNNYNLASEQGDHVSGSNVISINSFFITISVIICSCSQFLF